MDERREGFTELCADIAVIKNQLHNLLGNGQPGLIEIHNQRITRLEKYVWGAIGVIAFVEFLQIMHKG